MSQGSNVRLDKEQYEKLSAIKAKTGLQIAGIVRVAVDMWLEKRADSVVREITRM